MQHYILPLCIKYLIWRRFLGRLESPDPRAYAVFPREAMVPARLTRRRAASALADLAAAAEFDMAKAKVAADLKVRSAEKLSSALVAALARLHALLDPDQRERLAYLVRTGVVQL
jgi:hypothetical protein